MSPFLHDFEKFQPQNSIFKRNFPKTDANLAPKCHFLGGFVKKVYPRLRTSGEKYTLGWGMFAKNTPLAKESGLKKWPLGAALSNTNNSSLRSCGIHPMTTLQVMTCSKITNIQNCWQYSDILRQSDPNFKLRFVGRRRLWSFLWCAPWHGKSTTGSAPEKTISSLTKGVRSKIGAAHSCQFFFGDTLYIYI